MKLLLVEDNKDLALNIIEYLESKGHIIDYAADGLTALNLFGDDKFDVIVLDVMLPGIDGFTVWCFVSFSSDHYRRNDSNAAVWFKAASWIRGGQCQPCISAFERT